jgi:peptidoglycan biosynthesis protein MviN/MurJ (putative lipid II flippase)
MTEAPEGASPKLIRVAEVLEEESPMDVVGLILSIIAGIGSLVCFILVLVEMFRRGNTGLGIACIVLALCCGIGGLVAFVYGWIRHREWGLTNVMIIWTVCWILSAVGYVVHPFDIQQFQPRLPGP